MRFKYNSWLLFLLIIVSSCSTLKIPIKVEHQIDLTLNNLTLLNGVYNRLSTDNLGSNVRDLFWDFFLRGYPDDKQDFIRLAFQDERHVKISLIKKDSVITTKSLKGRIRNNTFEFNRRVKIIPLIVSNVYKDSKIRIAILQNGNLNVDAKTMTYGIIYFIIPAGGAEKRYNMQFEKARDK